ncbi:hypothetical protein MJG53_005546 [Ovis ammon polii x Ovis aries]|uniref:Uncharacterized protein n=1 Tax=Ovis ammon polii x Ovis aries TaxID=2918886 RepID=A0ACB9VDF1_9CETA|nr:hypothetical protein MJG53_005546 [Ovis ammon polii x Ovis aries]
MPLGSGPWSGECEMRQRAEACCSTPEPTGCKDEVESFEPNNQERRVLVRKPRWRVIASGRRHMLPPEVTLGTWTLRLHRRVYPVMQMPQSVCLGTPCWETDVLIRWPLSPLLLLEGIELMQTRDHLDSRAQLSGRPARASGPGFLPNGEPYLVRNPDQKRREQLGPAQSQPWKAAGSRAPLEAAAPRKSRKANRTGLVG